MTRRPWLRNILWLLAGVLAALMILRSLDPGERRIRFTPTAAELALERKMPLVELDGVPLDHALDALGKQWNIEVVPEWHAGKQVGFMPGRPVRFRGRNITLEDALTGALKGWSDDPEHSGFIIRDGRIVVTTDPSSGKIIRIYDVSDLCQRPDLMAERGFREEVIPTQQTAAEKSPVEVIMDLLVEAVEPDGWMTNGGTAGDIRALGNRLYVVGSWQTHLKLRRILAQLRDVPSPSANLPASSEPLEVRVWDERVKRWFSPNPSDTLQLLRAHIGTVSMHGLPLDQAITSIAEKSKAPIYLDRGSLPPINIEPQAPVSIDLPNPTLGEVLRLLVRVDSQGRIGFFIDPGGVIVITTRGAELSTPVITETYDLREWLAALGYSKYSDFAMQLAGRSPAATSPSAPTGLSRDEAIEELMKTISSQIDPGSWRDAGSQIGSMRQLNGILVVTQTYDNHEKIEKLFEAIRADPRFVNNNPPTTQPRE